MLKKIIIIGFLLSGFLLAQQYSNEKYEKYVGTKLGKYPLTVTGLKKAINALDSGVVYISYPGLWDTTGLGIIPYNINIEGEIGGIYQRSNKPIMYTFRPKNYEQGFVLNAYPNLNIDDSQSYGYMLNEFDVKFELLDTDTMRFFDVRNTVSLIELAGVKRARIDKMVNQQARLDIFDTLDYTIPKYYGYEHQISPEKFGNIYSYLHLTLGAGYVSDFNRWASGGLLIDTYYGFLSDFTKNASTTITEGYHFYGLGNVPSWFGGNVNAVGYNFAADTSSTDDYKIVLAGAHTLIAGLDVTFKALTANDSSATLQINSLTATPLTKANSGAINTSLSTGDILAGQIVKAVYDGTQFQIISRLAQ